MLGMGNDAAAELATVFSHEGTHKNGNRVEGIAHSYGKMTYQQLAAQFGLQNESFVNEMNEAIKDPNSWVENEGPRDNWKLNANGNLEWDGDGWLKDQNGEFVLDDNGNRIGHEKIEMGLLAILTGEQKASYADYSEEDKNKVSEILQEYLTPSSGTDRDSYQWYNNDGMAIKLKDYIFDYGTQMADETFTAVFHDRIQQAASVYVQLKSDPRTKTSKRAKSHVVNSFNAKISIMQAFFL